MVSMVFSKNKQYTKCFCFNSLYYGRVIHTTKHITPSIRKRAQTHYTKNPFCCGTIKLKINIGNETRLQFNSIES